MPTKTWAQGEEVLAADMNTYLQKQVVAVFVSSAARGSAIPAPSAGMVTYQLDTNRLEVYNGAAWVATSPTTLGYVETTGPQNGIQSTLVDLTGLTTAITVLANRRIEVAASVNFNKISSDVATWVQLNVVGLPGGITAEAYSDCPAPGNLHIYSSRMATPAAGTYTIKAQAATGAGFVNAHASNRWLRVIDWGPV